MIEIRIFIKLVILRVVYISHLIYKLLQKDEINLHFSFDI